MKYSVYLRHILMGFNLPNPPKMDFTPPPPPKKKRFCTRLRCRSFPWTTLQKPFSFLLIGIQIGMSRSLGNQKSLLLTSSRFRSIWISKQPKESKHTFTLVESTEIVSVSSLSLESHRLSGLNIFKCRLSISIQNLNFCEIFIQISFFIPSFSRRKDGNRHPVKGYARSRLLISGFRARKSSLRGKSIKLTQASLSTTVFTFSVFFRTS